MIKSYFINLDRNADRMDSVRARTSALGIAYERFPAVDGSKVSDRDFESFKSARPRQAPGKSWNRGQMGCFLSHYALWQIAAQSADSYTAIFEDDIHLSDALPHFLNDTSWIPDGVDIVRLETSTNRLLLGKDPLSTHHGREIRRVLSTSWCAGGYIISRKCAQYLVGLPTATHDTADHFLFSFEHPAVADKITIAQVVPALCIQDKFFYADAGNVKFRSEIVENHEGTTLQARIKYLFKRSPLTFLRKTLQGYKRIHFAA